MANSEQSLYRIQDVNTEMAVWYLMKLNTVNIIARKMISYSSRGFIFVQFRPDQLIVFGVYSQYCAGNQMWKSFSATSFIHDQRVEVILQVDSSPQEFDSVADMGKLLD
jgi:hypothetical protein